MGETQAERTELAWRRTQLSLLVIACLALRGADPLLALVALGSATVLWLGQHPRYRHSLAMLRDENGQARPCSVLGTGLAMMVMTLLAMAKAAMAG
ncbi:DUF202 domain-containing protein [Pseudomonas solani]|uniref:DUF202 domain-containing protein n=1 Tax=Pseudomonas solani TaxID=2731552 RepID=UPI003C2ADC4D